MKTIYRLIIDCASEERMQKFVDRFNKKDIMSLTRNKVKVIPPTSMQLAPDPEKFVVKNHYLTIIPSENR